MGGQQGDPASFHQIVGNIRLASTPRRNHWWHITFHLTGRGITTRPVGSDPMFAIDFDFVEGPFIFEAASADGRIAVPCHRYVKALNPNR